MDPNNPTQGGGAPTDPMGGGQPAGDQGTPTTDQPAAPAEPAAPEQPATPDTGMGGGTDTGMGTGGDQSGQTGGENPAGGAPAM